MMDLNPNKPQSQNASVPKMHWADTPKVEDRSEELGGLLKVHSASPKSKKAFHKGSKQGMQ
jgi:hypothetical protein